ncbi:TetR/AcrR family transcriptional regulator [Streptomyces sp. NPDC005012]|uniref:TetR/AcrR family transcriptional regulator n=1 Tax=unclassified Streptomyces TaxID=2593676 RepID=UPI0033B574A0
MGHREDLLEGAKRCLLEQGFARTTARDIVRASGANLASIGYHYGSKDALLAQAYVALVEDQAERFDWDAGPAGTAPGSPERVRAVLRTLVDSLRRPDSIWHLSMEIIALGDRLPEIRRNLAEAQKEGGRGLAALLLGIPEEEVDDELTDTVGGLAMVLMSGLIAQHTLDPEFAPDGDRLADGLFRLVGSPAAGRPAPAEGR